MNKVIFAVVRDDKGDIDQALSMESAAKALLASIAENETATVEIAAAVTAVFDEHKGVRMNKPYVISQVNSKLGTTQATYTVMSEKINTYLKANSKEGGLFVVQKGRDGGIARVSDLPAKTEETATA